MEDNNLKKRIISPTNENIKLKLKKKKKEEKKLEKKKLLKNK